MEKTPSSEIASKDEGPGSRVQGQGEDRNNQELCGISQHALGPEPETQDSGPQVHLVTFTLEKEEFAVDIDRVQEIIRVGQITPVPNTPEFIDGVINLRGKVIPVFNLRRRLNLAEGALTKHSRIMIVETKTRVLGMLVDAVQQVLWLPAASVEAPPEEAGRTTAKVKGIGKLESRLIMLMDLDRVLAKEAQPAAA
ncbi:MAG TPA: chemotaxis protein CheW [Nitrospiraceae bacterium]|nr:chemotaxis protein CheW [Nitrospiraceae bacterium]